MRQSIILCSNAFAKVDRLPSQLRTALLILVSNLTGDDLQKLVASIDGCRAESERIVQDAENGENPRLLELARQVEVFVENALCESGGAYPALKLSTSSPEAGRLWPFRFVVK